VYFQPRKYAFRRPPGLGSSRPDRCPIVIVGAGPVGLTLALALARHGESAVLIEQNDSVGGGSRALGMSRRTLEIWEALGAGERILGTGLPWNNGRTFYRGKMVIEFEMPSDPSVKHPPMVNVQQSFTDQELVDAIGKENGVDLRWHTRVTDVRVHADGAIVSAQTPEGAYDIEADFVIACDGPRSRVRGALGLHMVGSTFEARYVIVDVSMKSACPPGRRAWFDPPSNPGSTVIMHKQPDDIWRIDYQLREDEEVEAAVREEAVRERVQRHLDYIGETAPWRMEWTSWYKAHSRSLPSFRHGPVFFAGDAAHLIPIFGIRGLNSGVEDAWTLAWKLALYRQGRAGPQLLEAYSEERTSAARENIAQANRSTCIMTPPTSGMRLVRDSVLSLAITQESVRGILNPRQGTPASAHTSPLNSYPERSAEFPAGPQPGEITPNLLVDGVPLHQRLDLRQFTALFFANPAPKVGIGAVVLDDDAARKRFGADRASCYLVRPDHLVCARWKNFNGAELEVALAQACARATVH
jgi:3-(3-hydroxy-phenyl)propionate hydroxylase